LSDGTDVADEKRSSALDGPKTLRAWVIFLAKPKPEEAFFNNQVAYSFEDH